VFETGVLRVSYSLIGGVTNGFEVLINDSFVVYVKVEGLKIPLNEGLFSSSLIPESNFVDFPEIFDF